MSFTSVMDKIGHDAKLVFTEIEHYLPLAESVAVAAYPAGAPVVGAVNAINNLVVKLVTVVEQKYALAGQATGTGLQKSADVIAVSAPIVSQILSQVGVKTDINAYIQSIIDAAVSAMKVPVLANIDNSVPNPVPVPVAPVGQVVTPAIPAIAPPGVVLTPSQPK